MTGVRSLLSCDGKSSDLPLRSPTLETELCIVHSALIAEYEKEIYMISLTTRAFVVSVCIRENLYLLLASVIILNAMYGQNWRPMFWSINLLWQVKCCTCAINARPGLKVAICLHVGFWMVCRLSTFRKSCLNWTSLVDNWSRGPNAIRLLWGYVLTLVEYLHTIPFRPAKAPCFSSLCH